MNSEIGEWNRQKCGNGGDLHASAAIALYDSITPDTGTRSAKNAANRINNSRGNARARDAHVVYPAKERREKCADGIKVEVHQRAGDGDPPEGGDTQHGPDGTGINRGRMFFR